MPTKHPEPPGFPDSIPMTYRDHPDYDPLAPPDLPMVATVIHPETFEEAPSQHKSAKPAGKEN